MTGRPTPEVEVDSGQKLSNFGGIACRAAVQARCLKTTLDCQTCGACCCNPDENRAEGFVDYIEVRAGERLYRKRDSLRRFTVLNGRGERHMKLLPRGRGEERCAALQGALGKRVTCLIYDDRLAGCRKVEAGSDRCLQYRRERSIDSL